MKTEQLSWTEKNSWDKDTSTITLKDSANFVLTFGSRENLEKENIELTNTMYEIENSLQSQIDKINPPKYNLQKFKIGE